MKKTGEGEDPRGAPGIGLLWAPVVAPDMACGGLWRRGCVTGPEGAVTGPDGAVTGELAWRGPDRFWMPWRGLGFVAPPSRGKVRPKDP